jgi:hypothetical protein
VKPSASDTAKTAETRDAGVSEILIALFPQSFLERTCVCPVRVAVVVIVQRGSARSLRKTYHFCVPNLG